MAHRDSNNHTGRTVALVGGGALLVWLLLRGKRWGLGGGGGGTSTAHAGATPGTPDVVRPRCKIWIRARSIDLDGAPTALDTLVTRCRSGRADVQATGGASIQAILDVVRALQGAGVYLTLSENVSDVLKMEEARKP